MGAHTFAQEEQSELIQLEAITVSAEKQEEEVQKVPSAITVFTETALTDAGLNEIGDVIRQVPNMTFGETVIGSSPIFRGLRASQFTHKTPVVMYVDGIPSDSMYSFDADLNNIERIEVLRGAQGVLYGKNFIGGIVNVVSKKPDNFVDAKITAEYAENETYMTNAYGNGPIINDNGPLIRSDEVRYYDIRGPDDKKETDTANLAMNVTHAWDSITFHSVSTIGESEYEYRQNLDY